MSTTSRLDRRIRRIANEVYTERQRPATKPAPKPEHCAGEPCNLPIWELTDIKHTEEAKGLRFEYTGEYRTVPASKQEWHVAESTYTHGTVITFGWDSAQRSVWILRVVPKWEPKVGETCWWDGVGAGGGYRTPGNVTIIEDDHKTEFNIKVRYNDNFCYWTSRENLSPIEPDKWVVYVPGVGKVSASEGKQGFVRLDFPAGIWQRFYEENTIAVIRKFCADNHIPIKPFDDKK